MTIGTICHLQRAGSLFCPIEGFGSVPNNCLNDIETGRMLRLEPGFPQGKQRIESPLDPNLRGAHVKWHHRQMKWLAAAKMGWKEAGHVLLGTPEAGERIARFERFGRVPQPPDTAGGQ